jgi:pentatricopeptide repeat protein
MNRVGKSLQTSAKSLSKRVKQKLNEKKPVTFHKLPIKLVQPNIPIEEQKLTKAMREEIKKEFEKSNEKARFLTPDKMLDSIDFSFESFFSNRELDLNNFNKLLQVQAHHGKIDEALGTIEKMKIIGIVPDIISFVYLIVATGRANDIQTAEMVFSKALIDLAGPAAMLYTSLISAYNKMRDPDSVLRLINEKRSKGFKIHEIDYTCYILALSKQGRAKEAIEVYEKYSPEVDTDEYLLASVLNACSKISATEYAVGIWDRLKGIGFPEVAYFYNEMIMCYAKRKDYAQQAIELYKQMRGKGIIPDNRTFNGFFTACARLGDLPEARFGLKEMKNFGLEPTFIHLAQLMNVYSQATLDANEAAKELFVKESWEIFRICKERGIVDILVLNNLLAVHTRALFDNQVEGLVLPLYDQLGIKRDVHTYRRLMEMYSELAEYTTVKDLWKSMKQENIKPDMFVMNQFLKACMKTGDTDKTCEVLEKFKEQGLRPLYMYLRQLHKIEGIPMRLWAHLQDFEFYDSSNFNKKYANRLRNENLENRYTK